MSMDGYQFVPLWGFHGAFVYLQIWTAWYASHLQQQYYQKSTDIQRKKLAQVKKTGMMMNMIATKKRMKTTAIY